MHKCMFNQIFKKKILSFKSKGQEGHSFLMSPIDSEKKEIFTLITYNKSF